MNYYSAINRVYDQLENDHVDKAAMTCLRIARNLSDHYYTAIFLREFYPSKEEFDHVLLDDIGHLKEDKLKFLSETSLNSWIETRKINRYLPKNDSSEEDKIIVHSVGDIELDIAQCEKSIDDLTIPSGMNELDTAAFTDGYNKSKEGLRTRIRKLQGVKEQIKTKCLNYAIKIERQLQSQDKSETFIKEMYTEVNNFFKAYSEDVYNKLQKASQLIDSKDTEDCSLLLTQVRRAIEAAANYFYPPTKEVIRCSDGEARKLGEDKYLNRLDEYLLTFKRSSSHDLLRAEFKHLAALARRLYAVASKGVHSDVTIQDAKQGLISLYLLLYNIIVRLEHKPSQPNG